MFNYFIFEKIPAFDKPFSTSSERCQNVSMQLSTILSSRENDLIYSKNLHFSKLSGALRSQVLGYTFAWLNYSGNSSKWLSGEEMIYKNFCTDSSDIVNCGQKAGDNMCLVVSYYFMFL